MPITVTVSPSIEIIRELNDPNVFARIELNKTTVPKDGTIRPWHIEAHETQIPKSSDCGFSVFLIEVVVNFIERLNITKINRSYFDPDPARPHGYEADAPRDPSHWRLDESNVSAHEYSHVMDVVKAVEQRLNQIFNAPGVTEQLSLRWRCQDEQGVYDTFYRLVRQRINAIGLSEFENLLADFQRHRTDSETERQARQAQISEHESRQDN